MLLAWLPACVQDAPLPEGETDAGTYDAATHDGPRDLGSDAPASMDVGPGGPTDGPQNDELVWDAHLDAAPEATLPVPDVALDGPPRDELLEESVPDVASDRPAPDGPGPDVSVDAAIVDVALLPDLPLDGPTLDMCRRTGWSS